MRAGVVGLAVLCAWAVVPATAQDRERTLADIRQELSVLYVELQDLKRELSTTGAPSSDVAGTTLDRVNAIEEALTGLTARTEELEHRIERIVEDGTNRLGDLEFRLVELEGGDVSQLSETTTLGGASDRPEPAAPSDDGQQGAQMAMGEQADFDRARDAFDAGDYRVAADRFAEFAETYPGGPLTGEAHFWRGEALSARGETAAAARAYLDSFSGAPSGDRAPDALTALGRSLGDLGQVQEACVTLGEVDVRFPDSAAASEAASARQALDCL